MLGEVTSLQRIMKSGTILVINSYTSLAIGYTWIMQVTLPIPCGQTYDRQIQGKKRKFYNVFFLTRHVCSDGFTDLRDVDCQHCYLEGEVFSQKCSTGHLTNVLSMLEAIKTLNQKLCFVQLSPFSLKLLERITKYMSKKCSQLCCSFIRISNLMTNSFSLIMQ